MFTLGAKNYQQIVTFLMTRVQPLALSIRLNLGS